jgi:hypothetical protein
MNITRLIIGMLWGGAIGGVLGLLIGAGALAVPGLGPAVAAGTLATALGAVMIRSLIDALIGGATALMKRVSGIR